MPWSQLQQGPLPQSLGAVAGVKDAGEDSGFCPERLGAMLIMGYYLGEGVGWRCGHGANT